MLRKQRLFVAVKSFSSSGKPCPRKPEQNTPVGKILATVDNERLALQLDWQSWRPETCLCRLQRSSQSTGTKTFKQEDIHHDMLAAGFKNLPALLENHGTKKWPRVRQNSPDINDQETNTRLLAWCDSRLLQNMMVCIGLSFSL